MTKRQLTALIIAFQLRLNFICRVIEYEMITARTVAEFAATQAGKRPLLRQRPWRHMLLVIERAEDERMIDVTVRVDNGHFFADAG